MLGPEWHNAVNIAVLPVSPSLCLAHTYSQFQTLSKNKDVRVIFL